jgi:hypothetical protein
MAKMIGQLPDTSVLFRSYLELDMANVVTILSFDTETVAALLTPQNVDKINHKYPIFYKVCKQLSKKDLNRVEVLTAVDIALNNNQSGALNLIVAYIVKY